MKKLAIVLLILTLVFSSVACGDSKGGDTAKGTSTGTKAEETMKAETPKEKVKLKIGLPHGYELTPKEIVDGFIAKNPNVEVSIEEAPWGDFATKLVTEIAAGNPPDTFWQEAGVIAGFAAKGACVDLTEYINRDIKSDEYTQLLFSGKDGSGKIWGIPHGVNPIALAYNKKIFTEANVSLPTKDWTYQDIFDAAKKLTKDTNGDGKTDIYGLVVGYNITQGWFPFIKSTGGQVLDSTLTKAMFDDPKSIEGLKKFASLANELRISPTRAATQASGGDWAFFGSGKGAMYFIQAGSNGVINGKFPELDWDVVMMPKGWDGNRVVPTVANNWAIYSKTDKTVQDAAWAWLAYWLGDDAQKIFGQKTPAGFPIKLTGLAEVEKSSAKPVNMKAYTDGMAEGGQTLCDNPTWGEWVGEAQKVMFDLYDGKVTAEDAGKKASEAVQKVLDSAK